MMRIIIVILLMSTVLTENSYSQSVPLSGIPRLPTVRLGIQNQAQDPSPELVEAIKQGNDAQVNMLLENGRSPDATDSEGDPALFWAVRANRSDIVQTLLLRGADFRKRDDDGGTLLQTAAATGRVKTTKLILALGADVNEKDLCGHTALMYAVFGATAKATPTATLQALLEEEVLSLAPMIGNEHLEVAKLLITAGADVNAQAEDCGLTALMIAALSGNAEIAKVVLAAGADMSKKSGEWDASRFAVALDSPEEVEKELEDNFEPGDNEGRKAFTEWVQLTKAGRTKIAAMIRERESMKHQ